MAESATFRPKRILVHLDTASDRRPALTRALHLAQTTRGALRLVEVLVPLPRHTPNATDLEELLRKEMTDRLAAAAALARRMGIRVTTALLRGDVATMLVDASRAWRADVLLRSHGIHQAAAGPIGPTDSQLVRRCPCPVWFVTNRHGEGEQVVVAAVDPDPDDGPRHMLSVRVVQAAVAVATAAGATLHIDTHEDLARRMGKSRTNVTESLALAQMPTDVRNLCRLADISSKSLLLQIVRQQDPQKMIALIERLTRDGGGAAVTRERARKVAAKPKAGRPRAFVFNYRAPAKTFNLKLQFKKADVDKSEVIAALEGIIKELRKG